MSEIDELRAQVAKQDKEIGALFDFTMHMFEILMHRDFDKSPPEEFPVEMALLKKKGADKGDEPHTLESLLQELHRRVTASRAKD